MKVIINALQFKNANSGIGILLRDLFGRYTSITKRHCRVILPQYSPNFPGDDQKAVFAPCSYEQGIRRMLYQSLLMGYRHCRDSALLTVDSKVPFLLPRSCHVIPLITDLAVFRLPETYQKSRVALWRTQYRFLCRRADCFLAISEFTKREMTEILGIPAEKIEVVYCDAPESIREVSDAVALQAVREKYSLPEHFILFVGNFNPRKNLERLIRAFDQLKQETPLPHQLVIAGGQGWKFSAEEALEGIRAKADVHFIGYVPDEDMPALYTAADLFAFTTLYEGFGIPIIEAQRCGTPVLTSSVSALPEIGGSGAYYVDPYSENEIGRGMKDILTDAALRDQLIREGAKNAKRFSWDRSAQRLNEIVEERIEKWMS